ncbi:MAG: hypothetical protein OXF01_02075, partial [Gemmatimonadetes bacterium]|nr:hypothetical protein [Gemmatimonadota bacterium]
MRIESWLTLATSVSSNVCVCEVRDRAARTSTMEPARFDQVTTGRATIFTGGRPVRLPDHRDGWRGEPYAVDGADVEAARQQLQRLMRDAEADIAEAL